MSVSGWSANEPQCDDCLVRNTPSRIWFGLLALDIVVGLVIQLFLIFTGGADANSGEAGVSLGVGTRLVHLFSFFTIQSNIVVLIAALAFTIRPARDNTLWRVIRLDALLGIVITGVVFAAVLAPIVHLTGAAFVATVCFHYIAPVMMLLGWLVFGPRPAITWNTVAWAFAWPVLWLVYTFIHGYATDWYPYPFLDVTKIGIGAALRNSLLVVVFAALLVLVFKLLDSRLPSRRYADKPSATRDYSTR